MPQLTYNWNPAVAYEGLVADSRDNCVIVTRLGQGLVPVGKLCAPGTVSLTGPPLASLSTNSATPGTVNALTTGSSPMADSEYVGVPIYDAAMAPYDATLGYACYPTQYPIPVLTRGAIYVKPEAGNINQQGDVYVRVSVNGALTTLGAFAPAAGTGLVLFPNGRFISGSMTGGYAILLIG